MKFQHVLLTLSVCASTAVPVLAIPPAPPAPLEVDAQVSYKTDVASDDASCSWEPALAPAVVKSSQDVVVLAGDTPTAAGRKLSLQVIRFDTTRSEKKSQYIVGVRAEVRQGGKLLSTRDFQTHDSFRNDKGGCDELKSIAATLGKQAGKWLQNANFIECGQGCAGIRPDETIVVGTEVVIPNPATVNQPIRDECRFPTQVMEKLVKRYNEIDYPPQRAKLEARPIDIQDYAGRRLVLKVTHLFAIGGGGYTGGKALEMTGELFEGKLLTGSFNVRIEANRSGFGFPTGTCKTVSSMTDSAVKLIANWLQGPTLDAQLK